ncbi:hypothetical protein Q7P37_006359 [Cladosporium fusiforme]
MSENNQPTQLCPHHVLDFLVDDSDSCALTVYTENNTRMHIIADAEKLKELSKSKPSSTYDEYIRLVAEFRKSNDGEPSGSVHDSAVDETTAGKEDENTKEGSSEDAEETLQSWILGPVRRQISQDHKQPNLQEWYDAETHFYELEISKADELSAVELEASSELKRRMAKLKPDIALPKYIREMGYPFFDATKMTVLAGSGSPLPYHPTQVRCEETGEKYFFKAVDSQAPQTTKRELWHLHRIAKPDIVDQIRAPRLVGLVSSGNSQTRAMGFLQQDIPNPVPLTYKLDAKVPQEKRDAWAAEAESMKNVLHKRRIIWGDAKADNFLVSEDDRLWIIDFGGSWTEGWIDPEIKETIEGDDMATQKIVNALHDPVANVEGASSDDGKSQSEDEAHTSPRSHGKKRKASEQDSPKADATEKSRNTTLDEPKRHKKAEESTHDTASRVETPQIEEASEPEVVPTPRRKSKQIENQAAERYCYCDSPSAGPMIGCDSPDCERQWFHFYCAGLKQAPPEDVAWFCRDCSR